MAAPPLPDDDIDRMASSMADSILEQLLGNRQFLDLWSKQVEHALCEEDEEGRGPSGAQGKEEGRDTVGRIVDDTNVAVGTIIDSWNRNYDFIFFVMDASERNPDSVALYDVEHLLRLVDYRLVPLPRLAAFARRIAFIAKILVLRLSNRQVNVSNVCVVASSLCDLLYSLEEILHEREPEATESLRRNIDRMNQIVVGRLNQIHRELRVRQSPPSTPVRSRPSSSGHRRGHQPTSAAFSSHREHSARSTGFLLPLELQKSRARYSQKHPPRSAPARTVPPTGRTARPLSETPPTGSRSASIGRTNGATTPSLGQIARSVAAIEKRWAAMLENEDVFRKSMRTNRQGREALKVARNITQKVIEELDRNRNLALLQEKL